MTMSILRALGRGNSSDHERRTEADPAEQQLALPSPIAEPPKARSARTSVYGVRVADTFKGEMLALQAELQLERQRQSPKARKVTEGEVIEAMLDCFKTARTGGASSGLAVSLPAEVWQGIHAIARHRRMSPSQVVEELVVRQVAELRLLPQRRGE